MQKMETFQKAIQEHYQQEGRVFPWRQTTNPYHILLSEVMLQQTQTSRVVEKYLTFVKSLPRVEDLAEAPTATVLSLWQGLGYNRRALMLQRAAQQVMSQHAGLVPDTQEALDALPGIGWNTAGAVLAFSYNQPVVFIETNIRRVFIHAFFPAAEAVSDQELLPLIEQALDRQNPREWYWALMDYGAMLPKKVSNPNRQSKHYTRQSAFEGSNRQARGRIIKSLLEDPSLAIEVIADKYHMDPEKTVELYRTLEKEGFFP